MPEFEKCRVCGKEFLKYDQRGFRNAGFTAHQNKCVEKGPLPTRNNSPDDSKKRNQRLLLPASRSSELVYSPYSTKNRRKSLATKSKTPTVQSPVDYQFHESMFHASTSMTKSKTPTPPTVQSPIDYQFTESTLQINNASTSKGLMEDNIFPVMQCDHCTPNFGSHQPHCRFLTRMINQSRH